MDDLNSNKVNLSKPVSQPWTDPVTGEIYPGGAPVSMQQSSQQPYSAQPQYAQPAQQQPYAQQPYVQQQYAPPVQQPYAAPMPQQIPNQGGTYQPAQGATKFCKFCGGIIPMEAVVCTNCGRQVEQLQGYNQPAPQVIVNNSNMNMNGMYGTPKSKCVAFILCLLFGVFGVHRFYEGKIGTGILYFFTLGLCGIGVFIDLIIILTKSDPYYV